MVLQFRRNFSRLQPIPNPSPSGEGSLVIRGTLKAGLRNFSSESDEKMHQIKSVKLSKNFIAGFLNSAIMKIEPVAILGSFKLARNPFVCQLFPAFLNFGFINQVSFRKMTLMY